MIIFFALNFDFNTFKALKLSGINLKAAEIVQVGQTLEQTQIQQEKK